MDGEDDAEFDEQEHFRNQTRLFVTHVRKNDLPGINSMLENGYNINTVNSFGSSMMHLATRCADLETIRYLLDMNINHTAIDRQNRTPIMIAASRGDVEIFKLIAAKIAQESPYNPLSRSNSGFHVTPNGETLLMMACNKASNLCTLGINDVSILLVELLLASGFDPSTVDHKGRTALHYVAQSNRVDAHVTGLKIIGPEPNKEFVCQQDLDGNTALHIACKNRDGKDVVEFLLRNGALVSDTNFNMETPLHIAVRAYDVCGISRLLCQEWGADPLARDNMDRTSIHAAVEDPSTVVTLSVVKDYDRTWLCLEMLMGICDQRYPKLFLECRDNRGMTPLLLACQQSNHYFASRLLQIPGINFDAKDVDGMTATHFCARRGCRSEIDDLIKLGANINTRNKTGETPLVIASKLNGARYGACMTLLIDRVKLTETRSAAFAMGLHSRLGRESSTRFIPPELLHALLKLV
jgi:ankyrin repeat protein